jgi:hypothetical protein
MPNFAIYGKKKVQPRARHLVTAACPAFVSRARTCAGVAAGSLKKAVGQWDKWDNT